jgi:hypothetical protein
MIVREQVVLGQRSISRPTNKAIWNYSHWPLWAQAVTGWLLLAVLGTLYWFAWIRLAIRSFAKLSPAALHGTD